MGGAVTRRGQLTNAGTGVTTPVADAVMREIPAKVLVAVELVRAPEFSQLYRVTLTVETDDTRT
jgi:hypothetical protein